MEKNPQDPEIYQDLGQRLHRQNHVKEAIACYRKSMELRGEPLHLWFYRNLGEALLELRQS